MTFRRVRMPAVAASVGVLVATSGFLTARDAAAQSWPTRTVKLVVPLGPGSGADIGARVIADFVSKAWGQPVVVENRPGGDSIVAITAVITANDDHTLLWGPSAAFTAHPYSHAKVPYDIKEIFPIVRVSNTLVAVSVPSASPAKSLADLVKIAKEQPGKLNWASVTGLNDFLFQAFVKEAGINMVRVPYRDAVQAATDLGEDRIQAFSSAYAIARPQIQSGKIRVLALTNTKRAEILSEVPTVREAGYPAMEFDGMVGGYGTKAVSDEVKRRISADVRESLRDKFIHERLTVTGQVVNPGDTAEFIAAIAEQSQVAAGAAKILGVKAAQ